ncbi:MAG: polysaccharide pyruvyl transferase family protein [Bacteroidaceae bacterium]|nr:polysaccharide pyruvyl transferase family protein [Bacteroidaceae bacterium]
MNQNNRDICSRLRSIIEEQLTPLIESDYFYLDLPYHSNIGDSLIWMGTEHFLKRLPYQCLGSHSIGTFTFGHLPKDAVILLHGGGNFGDVWRKHQDFRLKVINNYPDNRIIILPQTIYYESASVLAADIQEMNRHSQLTVCARDNQSASLLKENGFTGRILKLPDMAFCIDRNQLAADKMPVSREELILLRKDKESPLGTLSAEITSANVDIRDWPNQKKAYKIAKGYTRKHTAQETDVFFQTDFLPRRISEGVKFVSEYRMVCSTRLHVAILRLLLDLPVKVMDNSYGKNLNFYNTWLTDSELVSTPGEEELKQLGMMVETCRQKLKTGKGRKQYRALLWFLSAILLVCTLVLLYILLSDKY